MIISSLSLFIDLDFTEIIMTHILLFAISGGTWAVYPQRLQVEIVKIFG